MVVITHSPAYLVSKVVKRVGIGCHGGSVLVPSLGLPVEHVHPATASMRPSTLDVDVAVRSRTSAFMESRSGAPTIGRRDSAENRVACAHLASPHEHRFHGCAQSGKVMSRFIGACAHARATSGTILVGSLRYKLTIPAALFSWLFSLETDDTSPLDH